MTVDELIDKLSELPPDMPVLVCRPTGWTTPNARPCRVKSTNAEADTWKISHDENDPEAIVLS